MDRRSFLKAASLGGTAVYVPASFTIDSLLNRAYAASPNYDALDFDFTDKTPPQVINIFLYGGPSELSGNLSIIDEIASASQSSYANNINGILTTTATDPDDGQITPNGFWAEAGGNIMEFLVDNGYMSVYRTMMKRANDTRSHRESIFQSQKGTTDIELRPGIGTVLAHALRQNPGGFEGFLGKSINNLILPFVSLEGETTFFAPDPENSLGMELSYQTLGTDLENPFARSVVPIFDNLVKEINDRNSRFSKVKEAFVAREQLETQIGNIGERFEAELRFSTAALDAFDAEADFTDNGDGTSTLEYPNNRFAEQIRAAVTLAVENPDTLFVSAGNVDLGGWDDHNNGCDQYADRMQDLFETLRVACKQIKYSDQSRSAGVNNAAESPGGVARDTGNIMINVYGEFGRRCNLNGSCGWDHGNCQNLFTLMGENIRASGALGKVVGRTRRVGDVGTNNQMQVPRDNSYEFEPASVASTIYAAFGVQNPEILTADENLSPDGSPPIDETVDGEPSQFNS